MTFLVILGLAFAPGAYATTLHGYNARAGLTVTETGSTDVQQYPNITWKITGSPNSLFLKKIRSAPKVKDPFGVYGGGKVNLIALNCSPFNLVGPWPHGASSFTLQVLNGDGAFTPAGSLCKVTVRTKLGKSPSDWWNVPFTLH